MRFPALHIPLLVVLAVLTPRGSAGQASPFVPLDDPVYETLRGLQIRGLMDGLHPTALPYTEAEIAAAARAMDPVDDRARQAQALLLARFVPPSDRETFAFSGKAGARATSHGRLDPVRLLEPGDKHVYPFTEGGLEWSRGAIMARTGFRFDYYWDRDPDGLDAVLRALMRNEHTYVGLAGSRASVHLGRIATRWASSRGSALLVSDNPRTFDALHVKLGNGRVQLRSMIGELDNITGDGRFTGTAGDDSVRSGSERRWMAAHRLDWRPSPDFMLTLMEGVLFSGPSTGLSLKYLNPAQFIILSVDNRPKNEENNAFLAMALWGRIKGWTLEGQLLVDDVDLAFGKEPGSFAAGVSGARAFGPAWDLELEVEAVASRTYNTFQPEGRWLYLQRGIGSQYSDYFRARVAMGWQHPRLALRVEPYLHALWQGERDIRQAFRSEDDFPAILVGTVERTLRPAVQTTLQHGRWVFASLDAGVNAIENRAHVDGSARTRVVVTAAVGIRWRSRVELKAGS